MKINVICIYYLLLLVFVTSSCLLVVLVASESIKLTNEDVPEPIDISNSSAVIAATVLESSMASLSETDGTESPTQTQNTTHSEWWHENSAGQQGAESNQTNDIEFTASEDRNDVSKSQEQADGDESEKKTESYIVRAEPKQLTGNTEALIETVTEEEFAKGRNESSVDQNEDQGGDNMEVIIPSFSEWTQKQLEEELRNASGAPPAAPSSIKVRSKNYASPDCGAKIVAANPEAASASAVLSPNRDEYKLNACTNRIWFVVELCEPIQARKIDVANFELFSSSPKDFQVSISDRFPTRDWLSIGQYQAKDERDVQSFNLQTNLFGKFVKFEMLSHWGAEHFCPISLFRVYGTSEFEVLDTENSIQDHQSHGHGNTNANGNEANEDDTEDDDEEALGGEATNNLFGSARDAVISIVKKAAEVLVKSGDKLTNVNRSTVQSPPAAVTTPLMKSCSTPSHLIVCNNCGDLLYGEVYELLSCSTHYLTQLMYTGRIVEALYNTDICFEFGLEFYSTLSANDSKPSANRLMRYVSTFLSPPYLAALCNVLAVHEHKVGFNTSNRSARFANQDSLQPAKSAVVLPFANVELDLTAANSCPSNNGSHPLKTVRQNTCANTKLFTMTPSHSAASSSHIKPIPITPTKTFRQAGHQDAESSHDSSSTMGNVYQSELTTYVSSSTLSDTNPELTIPVATFATITTTTSTTTTLVNNTLLKNLSDSNVTQFENTSSSEQFDQLDKLLSELNLDPASTTITPPNSVPQQIQKESVFLRLSNRIKALERNMSLSGQYLEELSQRYKKQVEEMQRAFEKKLVALSEENKQRDEFEKRVQFQMEKLTAALDALLTERASYWDLALIFGLFIGVEVLVACVVMYLWYWRAQQQQSAERCRPKSISVGKMKRRQSIDTVRPETFSASSQSKRRRASEEAMSTRDTYQELLERRKRKKKVSANGALVRSYSMSSAMLHQTEREHKPEPAPFGQVFENGPVVLEPSEHSVIETINCVANDAKPKAKPVAMTSPFFRTALSARNKRSSTAATHSAKLRFFRNSSSQRCGSQPLDDCASLNSNDSYKKDRKSAGAFKRIFQRIFD